MPVLAEVGPVVRSGNLADQVVIDRRYVQKILCEDQLDEAEAIDRRALQLGEKVFGAEDAKVAAILSNISGVLKSKGDLDGALQYSKRALAHW